MTAPTTTAETPARIALTDRDRVGIIAGGGKLPLHLAKSLSERGHPPFVLMIDGEVDASSALSAYAHERIPLEDAGTVRGILKRHGITHVAMAGSIGRRPRLRAFRPSLGLLALLPRLAKALLRGDDGLLKLVIRHLEAAGIQVVGAHEIAPDLLAIEGPLTKRHPDDRDRRDLIAALQAARAIGALDIGQAAIAVNGRVIALEGIEGTEGLLARTRDLRSHGRIANLTGGVIVKCAKPGQELRADLPAIGPMTVESAHLAGLAGIGIEAGRSLVLDWGDVVRRADEKGLFVVGLSPDFAA